MKMAECSKEFLQQDINKSCIIFPPKGSSDIVGRGLFILAQLQCTGTIRRSLSFLLVAPFCSISNIQNEQISKVTFGLTKGENTSFQLDQGCYTDAWVKQDWGVTIIQFDSQYAESLKQKYQIVFNKYDSIGPNQPVLMEAWGRENINASILTADPNFVPGSNPNINISLEIDDKYIEHPPAVKDFHPGIPLINQAGLPIGLTTERVDEILNVQGRLKDFILKGVALRPLINHLMYRDMEKATQNRHLSMLALKQRRSYSDFQQVSHEVLKTEQLRITKGNSLKNSISSNFQEEEMSDQLSSSSEQGNESVISELSISQYLQQLHSVESLQGLNYELVNQETNDFNDQFDSSEQEISRFFMQFRLIAYSIGNNPEPNLESNIRLEDNLRISNDVSDSS